MADSFLFPSDHCLGRESGLSRLMSNQREAMEMAGSASVGHGDVTLLS